jgi:uncharacterized membrane protein
MHSLTGDFMLTRQQTRPTQPIYVQILWNRIKLSRFDAATLASIAALAICLYFISPATLDVACFTGLLFVCCRLFQAGIDYTSRSSLPFGVLQWVAAILGLTVVFQGFGIEPVNAQFFNSLESAMTDVISESGTGIDAGLIGTIFVFFRIIVILAFIVGVIVAFTQATRGNDWQPIANMLGIGIAFVIAVEIISILILGGTAGG